jgi:lipopolysaccharide export system permease protein
MGSIDKYIFRTTLASLALIPVSLAGALRIARALSGVELMTGPNWMILTVPGFDSRMIPALPIDESNARLPRPLGRRPVTA